MLQFENDGAAAGAFTISALASRSGFTVKFFKGARGSRNITAQVLAGIYRTDSIAAGGSRMIRVVITATRGMPVGSILDLLITASSSIQPRHADSVKATVRVI